MIVDGPGAGLNLRNLQVATAARKRDEVPQDTVSLGQSEPGWLTDKAGWLAAGAVVAGAAAAVCVPEIGSAALTAGKVVVDVVMGVLTGLIIGMPALAAIVGLGALAVAGEEPVEYYA